MTSETLYGVKLGVGWVVDRLLGRRLGSSYVIGVSMRRFKTMWRSLREGDSVLKMTAGLVRTRSRCLSWSALGRGSPSLRIHASAKSLGVCHLSGGQGLR